MQKNRAKKVKCIGDSSSEDEQQPIKQDPVKKPETKVKQIGDDSDEEVSKKQSEKKVTP